MLSERIKTLFSLLQCSNTAIAHYAGCSSANISRLRTGYRTPKPSSPSVRLLAEGVYAYADYENILPVLSKLTGCRETAKEKLIPCLIRWLYETDDVTLPKEKVTPKSRQTRTLQRQNFGEKIDQAMTLLDLSNSKLATLINIDDSLVSRYRNGIYSPHRNRELSRKISDALFLRAEKTGKEEAFAKLCRYDKDHFDSDAVYTWLYEFSVKDDETLMTESFLKTLESPIPAGHLPGPLKQIPETGGESCYYGTDGLRNAVIRFLSDAAEKGGELLLYSDEPMDWMTADRSFFALWAGLMMKCVENGVKIRIIHNLDRNAGEMSDAIRGWLPLYISGMIEPYIFLKEKNSRFYHTVFLHSGHACIRGFFPASGKASRSYEYITDPKHLELLEQGCEAMFEGSSPFLKVYREEKAEDYRRHCKDLHGVRAFLLNSFPVYMMPEKLFARIISRITVDEAQKAAITRLYHLLRKEFQSALKQNDIHMILSLTEEKSVSFGLDLLKVSAEYTEEEYEEHVQAIRDLVKKEKNFHLTLLPESPFRDLQIILFRDGVSVLRSKEPHIAFVFLNRMLTDSVTSYLQRLLNDHRKDRHSVSEELKQLL